MTRRYSAPMPVHVAETMVYNAVRWQVEDAAAAAKPCLIIGPPGIGKSTVAVKMAEEDVSILYLKATATTRTLVSFLRHLIEQLQKLNLPLYLPLKASQNDRYKAIVEVFTQFEVRALIIDEAQNLEWNVIRLLMDITEETGVPCCFIGNPAVLKRTKVSEPALAQLRSRVVGRTLELTDTTFEDVALIAKANGIEDSACQSLLFQLSSCSIEHRLRAVDEAIRRARGFAGGDAPIRLNHIRDALRVGFNNMDERGLSKLIRETSKKGRAA